MKVVSPNRMCGKFWDEVLSFSSAKGARWQQMPFRATTLLHCDRSSTTDDPSCRVSRHTRGTRKAVYLYNGSIITVSHDMLNHHIHKDVLNLIVLAYLSNLQITLIYHIPFFCDQTRRDLEWQQQNKLIYGSTWYCSSSRILSKSDEQKILYLYQY